MIGSRNTLILIQAKEKKAANSFENNFLKLMNNNVYGKIIGNLRKKIKVRLVNNAKDYKKYVSTSSFASQKMI